MHVRGISIRIATIILATMSGAATPAVAAAVPAAAGSPGPAPELANRGGSWILVSAGGWSTCAIRSDRTLWCWGYNRDGQVGDGATTTQYTTPVQVAPRLRWASVSVGGQDACAIDTPNGGLWCWGDNEYGQLGDNSLTQRRTPVRIGLDSGWRRVSMGSRHGCAIRADGSLWCWGDNSYGQLGNGYQYRPHMGMAPVPSQPAPVGTATNWVDVGVGDEHSCGLDADGGAWCWGYNGLGQLGDATAADRLVPTPVRSGSRWTRLSVGDVGACALDGAAVAWCWGRTAGLPGKGPGTTVPTRVDSGVAWAALSIGSGGVVCGTSVDTRIWCWGADAVGQSDQGEPRDRAATPVSVGPGAMGRTVSTGGGHACLIDLGGGLSCWGRNNAGQLGSGTQNSPFASIDPLRVDPGRAWKAVSAGTHHACAIDVGGGLSCWGSNDHGQLGDGTTTDRAAPVPVAAGTVWASVAADQSDHTCAIDVGGGLWCWGSNDQGELGDGTTVGRTTPVRVAADGPWSRVASGGTETCAIRADATLWCWGMDWWQQAGAPVRIGPGSRWSEVALNNQGDTTCAIRVDGTLWCFSLQSQAPQQVGSDSTWTTIGTGFQLTCGTHADGTLWCWGFNGFGAVGDGGPPSDFQSAPVRIGADRVWKRVVTGANGACAMSVEDTLWCWGENSHLQVGSPPQNYAGAPTQVGHDAGWTTAALGYQFTCAIRMDHSLLCWGGSDFGELGAVVPTPLVQRVRWEGPSIEPIDAS